MSKRKNNVVIPKNRDIEEVVEEDRIKRKKQERQEKLKDRIKVELPTNINTRYCENVLKRRNAIYEEEKNRIEYLKVLGKMLKDQQKER